MDYAADVVRLLSQKAAVLDAKAATMREIVRRVERANLSDDVSVEIEFRPGEIAIRFVDGAERG